MMDKRFIMVTHNPESVCDASRIVRILDGAILSDVEASPWASQPDLRDHPFSCG